MMAAPMTYRVNGTQYIAIIAGYGGGAVIRARRSIRHRRRIATAMTGASSH